MESESALIHHWLLTPDRMVGWTPSFNILLCSGLKCGSKSPGATRWCVLMTGAAPAGTFSCPIHTFKGSTLMLFYPITTRSQSEMVSLELVLISTLIEGSRPAWQTVEQMGGDMDELRCEDEKQIRERGREILTGNPKRTPGSISSHQVRVLYLTINPETEKWKGSQGRNRVNRSKNRLKSKNQREKNQPHFPFWF